jgi:carbonic anhydrase
LLFVLAALTTPELFNDVIKWEQILKCKTVHKIPLYRRFQRALLPSLFFSVQVIPDVKSEHPEIYGGGFDQVYRLIQYHFHWGQQDHEGSEHTLAGLQYPAELHLVHQGVENPSKLAVLGVFLRLSNDGKAFQDEANVLGQIVEPSEDDP